MIGLINLEIHDLSDVLSDYFHIANPVHIFTILLIDYVLSEEVHKSSVVLNRRSFLLGTTHPKCSSPFSWFCS